MAWFLFGIMVGWVSLVFGSYLWTRNMRDTPCSASDKVLNNVDEFAEQIMRGQEVVIGLDPMPADRAVLTLRKLASDLEERIDEGKRLSEEFAE